MDFILPYYIFVAVYWGDFIHSKRKPLNDPLWKDLLCLIFCATFWPISMLDYGSSIWIHNRKS